jgi:hypothetical protein
MVEAYRDTARDPSAQREFYVAVANHHGTCRNLEDARQLGSLGDTQSQQLGAYQTLRDLKHPDRIALVDIS